MLKVAIYARVSTLDKQDPEMQLRELRAFAIARGWTIAEEHIDRMTGRTSARPQYQAVIRAARARKIDILLVWKLDRFGRSVRDLINTLHELGALGVDFVSLRDQLDMTTPAGKLMVHILASFAEFERDIISERVRAGLANAKAKGKRLGRKPVAPIDRKKIIAAHIQEPALSVRAIARQTKQTAGTVHKTLSLFREGKLDADGFDYAARLC